MAGRDDYVCKIKSIKIKNQKNLIYLKDILNF